LSNTELSIPSIDNTSERRNPIENGVIPAIIAISASRGLAKINSSPTCATTARRIGPRAELTVTILPVRLCESMCESWRTRPHTATNNLRKSAEPADRGIDASVWELVLCGHAERYRKDEEMVTAEANTAAQSATPAYIPWRTFVNTLDALAQNMPNRIDKSAFVGQSGAVQSQLILAFRFFGLIDDAGKPSPVLHAIAITNEAARKAELRRLIEQRYAPLIGLNLMKTTPAEFAEKMTDAYNITGDTRIKATRFFLNAAEYVGIDVSPRLLRDKTKTIGAPSAPRKRRAIRPRVNGDSDDEPEGDEDEQPSSGSGESRSVELRSGGTLTISATTKFMSLSSEDRKFVFDLIDQLESYEKGGGAASKV
jgi:hypothetical protein